MLPIDRRTAPCGPRPALAVLVVLAVAVSGCVSTETAEEEYALALEHVRNGRGAEAVAAAEAAVDADPSYQPAVLFLAEMHTRSGQLDEAEAILVRFSEEHPESPLAHYRLGVVREGKGEEAAALESFAKAVQLAPEYPDVHGRMGSILLRRGQAETAMQVLETATALDPGDVGAWYLLARAADRARDHDAAVVAAREFVRRAKAAGGFETEIATVERWLTSVRPPLDDLERSYLGGFVLSILGSKASPIDRSIQKEGLLGRAPPSLKERDERRVHIRVFPTGGGPTPAITATAAGPSLIEATARACDDVHADVAFGAVLERIDETAFVFDLEIATPDPFAVDLPPRGSDDPIRTVPEVVLGRDGVIVESGRRRGVVLPSEAVHRGIADVGALLDLAAERAGLAPGSWRHPKVQPLRIRTQSLLVPPRRGPAAPARADRSGAPLTLVYGITGRAVATPDALRASAERGALFLARSLGASGRFVYEYDIALDEESTDYEILRHAGTTHALFEAAAATGRRELGAAGRLGAAWLAARIREDEAGMALVYENAAKLGGQALALLVFAEVASREARAKPGAADGGDGDGGGAGGGDGEGAAGGDDGEGAADGDDGEDGALADLPIGRAAKLRDGLAARIVAMQRPDGTFDTYYAFDDDAMTSERANRFYPGEAVYALAFAHAVADDAADRDAWLEAAIRGANVLFDQREAERRRGEPPLDAWLLKGIEMIHRARPERRWLDRAYVLADAIRDFQLGADTVAHPLLAGAYGDGLGIPWGAGTAALNEGMAAAAAMAARAGDVNRARRYREAATRAAEFQIRHEVRPTDAYWLPRPARAIGGFRFHLLDAKVRIDTVQHNISSLLAVADLIDRGRSGDDDR